MNDLNIKYGKTIKKDNLVLWVLTLSILSTVGIQFFLESSLYSLLRMALYILFGMALLSVNISYSRDKRSPYLNYYFVILYLSLMFCLIISPFKGEIVLDPFLQIAFPLVVLIIGFKNNLSKKQINNLVLKYMILVTILGLFVIFFYGSGFQITTHYFFASKNQVGPFIGSVAVMSVILLLSKSNGIKVNTFFLIALFIINLTSLLVIRNRSGLVALGICLIVFFISRIKIKKRFKKSVFLLVPLYLLTFTIILQTNLLSPIFNLIEQSFFLNYNPSSLNSASSGRTDVYLNVLKFLDTSPFFGELQDSSNIIDIPHNFLLYLWLRFGILGMLPVTVFYISLWVYVFVKTVFYKTTDISLYLLLFMLVISMFEYSYPFSPLTTVSFTWFLLGYYLSNRAFDGQSDANLQ